MIVDESKADFNYVYFFLISQEVTNYLCAPTTNTSGSHKRIDPDFLLDMEINFPSIEEQKQIGLFFEKIESEKEYSFLFETKSLEYLKNVYDYWFVSYNYPSDNDLPYNIGGGQLISDDRFDFRYPEGWNVDKLGKFFSIDRGVSYTPEDASTSANVNSIPLLRSNNIYDNRLIHDDIIYVNNKRVGKNQILSFGDIFICMSNGSKNLIGKNTIISFDSPYTYGAFCAKITDFDSDYQGFASMFFKSDYYKSYISQICANTSINNIGNEMLTDVFMPIPPLKIAKKFNDIYLNILEIAGKAHLNFVKTEELLSLNLQKIFKGILASKEE